MPKPEEEFVMFFRISGLDPAPFRNLFGLSDEKLGILNVKRVTADAKPGYPDRVEVRDAEPARRCSSSTISTSPRTPPTGRATPSSFARVP